MNWVALSPLEVAAAWLGLSALALWLYLHHRLPQRRRVSTLRFWVSVQPVSQPRRRWLREPWAFAAQVLFLLLLILAFADLRWGYTLEGRSVVIVVDASVWSQARLAAGGALIDRERAEAMRLLSSLPGGDRVLLLRAEADAPPVLPFTADRVALRRAVSGIQPTSGIADVPEALEIGRAALASSSRGLLIYVGPGMIDDGQARRLDEFRNSIDPNGRLQFLVRLVGGDELAQNRGITHLSLRRDVAEPDRWHLLTQLKNYSDSRTDVVLKLSINDQPIGQRTIALAPNELASAENEFNWDKGGLVHAEISPPDALEADNRATVSLPTFRTVQVGIFAYEDTGFASDLLPVLLSNPYLRVEMEPPGNPFKTTPDVAISQGWSVPAQFSFNSVYFVSGPTPSDTHSYRVVNWDSQHPVSRWVRSRDVSVRNPAKLEAKPGDAVLAYLDVDPPAPLIVAREQNGHRILIVGFDPHDSNLPMESAFPLLMAGGIEWLTHSVDEAADSLSTGELELPEPVTRIVGPSGKDVPFARSGGQVHLLALESGNYRVVAPSGSRDIAVSTPLLPADRLRASDTESAAIEREPQRVEGSRLWRWLLVFGIVALWAEWWLYYLSRERRRAAEVRQVPYEDTSLNVNKALDEREEVEPRKPNFVA